jgi:hypothetical protein
VPTSKRPLNNNAQYLRIASNVLKGATYEEVVNDDVIAIIAMFVAG